MDFAVPEPLQATLTEIREFLDEHVLPVEAVFRGAHEIAPVEAAMREVRAKAKARGLWLPQLSKRHGGMGLSLLEHGLVSEVLGRSPLGNWALNCQAPDAGNMEILAEYGSRAQRERFLDPLIAGETRSCFAMTEPDKAGSNPVWLGTTARREGDELVLDGRKWFTSGADGAAFVIVMAVTEPEGPPHKRASMIIVPTDTPGYTLVRNISVMGDVGGGWASHAEVKFEGCRVPVTNMLGFPGAGFLIAQARLGPGRIHHCMRWIGICERAFDMMCERAATRELAPGKMLGEKQTVQNWIAESRVEIDSARLAVLHAAWRIDAVGQKAARVEVSAIKFHVAKVLRNVLERSIQTHGALGITDDTVLSFFYRHERGAQIYDGADEVHKTVVARELLERHGLNLRKRGPK
ncbi:Acyl-CoA dehydrogenase [Enhygromyxa salina]|uniref:Acyl-CoA dehydrogenase n=1 Tax=Enhygromyxa salina TaxID=215803 RepID=A0A0C2D7R6_9BACT|nr:acyl-CoA dehydrogenase family protein [Enhygromyxa salina]KIG16062.1 Acyl-CoA dehydrogenase [Enhygromyxa salina]